jgi:diphthamide biosynthesis enzyme Dph1/Dph2-like protein
VPACRFRLTDPTARVNVHVCRSAIETARSARKFGVVLGTLGRQGNPQIVSRLQAALAAAGKSYIVLLLSELSVAKVVFLHVVPPFAIVDLRL